MNKYLHCGRRLRPIVGAFAVIALVMALCAAAFGSQAVAYQIDSAHTGSQPDGPTPPLTRRWSRDLGGPISYPLIAEGKVFVIVSNVFEFPSTYGTKLYALDERTGETVWSFEDRQGDYYSAGMAYDAGRVFVMNFDGYVRAFDASSGALLWTTILESATIYDFTAPPTAVAGTVYVTGAGYGGRIFALSAQDGTVKWHAPNSNGADSSPAVSSTGVYVSYSSLNVYNFSPTTGALIWQRGAGTGGGGRTPVLYNNRLYVRDVFTNSLVLDATTSAELGTFPDRTLAPAFSGSTGYFVGRGTLQARDAASLNIKWSFSGDSPIVTAPITVNGYVYVGSYSGVLYALNADTGSTAWVYNLGGHLYEPEEGGGKLLTGFAAADGLLVGAAEHTLFAFQSSAASPTGPATLGLSTATYIVSEDNPSGVATITVNRTGDNSAPASVDFATSDNSGSVPCQTNFPNGFASDRCDYATTVGTVRFAAGDSTPKTFQIPLINDAYQESNETFTVSLRNAQGAALGTATATVTIVDNDQQPVTANPINGQEFFIKQQYIDFLGRVAEPAGLAFWMNRMSTCPPGDICDRTDTARRFFESDEFKERGYYVYKLYDAVLGRQPQYSEFVQDVARLNGPQTPAEQRLGKDAYLQDLISKQEFRNIYGQFLNTAGTQVLNAGAATGFVDTLCARAGITPASRQTLINNLAAGRSSPAQTLEDFILTAELSDVGTKFYDRAIITMQYFGFLRRNPDPAGFNFWWNRMATPGSAQYHDYHLLISDFLRSDEYNFRFAFISAP